MGFANGPPAAAGMYVPLHADRDPPRIRSFPQEALTATWSAGSPLAMVVTSDNLWSKQRSGRCYRPGGL